MDNNVIWNITQKPGVPEIIAEQDLKRNDPNYQLIFSNDENCNLEKIVFTLNNDTALAARILLKILLRLRISPEAARETAKTFYRMTKEFPQGNQQRTSSSIV